MTADRRQKPRRQIPSNPNSRFLPIRRHSSSAFCQRNVGSQSITPVIFLPTKFVDWKNPFSTDSAVRDYIQCLHFPEIVHRRTATIASPDGSSERFGPDLRGSISATNAAGARAPRSVFLEDEGEWQGREESGIPPPLPHAGSLFCYALRPLPAWTTQIKLFLSPPSTRGQDNNGSPSSFAFRKAFTLRNDPRVLVFFNDLRRTEEMSLSKGTAKNLGLLRTKLSFALRYFLFIISTSKRFTLVSNMLQAQHFY